MNVSMAHPAIAPISLPGVQAHIPEAFRQSPLSPFGREPSAGPSPAATSQASPCKEIGEAAQANVRSVLETLKSGRIEELISPKEMAELLGLQIRAQDLAMKTEIISKTLETVTNTANTLSRTQT